MKRDGCIPVLLVMVIVVLVATLLLVAFGDLLPGFKRWGMLEAAPVPKVKRPAPPLDVGPGKWVLMWSGAKYDLTLARDGNYSCTPGGWYGSYSWDSKSRVLAVMERTGTSSDWLNWTANLSQDLTGNALLAGRTIEVKLMVPGKGK